MAGADAHVLQEAIVGTSTGYWLSLEDFVTSDEADFDGGAVADLGFPRDWPAVFSRSAALKFLVGKRGRVPSKRAAVAGVPTEEQQAHIPAGLRFQPLQSFENAELAAERVAGLVVVQGWAVFERLDRPAGAAFVAERYWWNSLPDGTWLDLTPRPACHESLLLCEAAAGSPKSRSTLTAPQAALRRKLLRARWPGLEPAPAAPRPSPPPAATAARSEPVLAAAKASGPVPAGRSGGVAAAPVDYSKWNTIVDSDDEEEVRAKVQAEQVRGAPPADYGVKDLADGVPAAAPNPLPEYLGGSAGGGGGTNCFTSICRLLDSDPEKAKGQDNAHQLAQTFGKIFRGGFMDKSRQAFFKQALAEAPANAFVVILGLGSVLPVLEVARRGPKRGVVLEASSRLADLGLKLLGANDLSLPVVHAAGGYAKEEKLRKALASYVPKDAKRVVVLTELMAPDLLSSGLVPASVAAHAAVKSLAPKAHVQHIPQTVELRATPAELRTETLGGFDLRPFNMLRHTSSNAKADFWWWGVRLDNQPETSVSLLGPTQTLCGFDFDRSPEISLDEVRRSLMLPIGKRGRCNAVAMWWTARSGTLEYSTAPRLAEPQKGDAGQPGKADPIRSEWKQAVHYLAGETSVFVGDTLEVAVSITPCFTVRMMQESKCSVAAPAWIQAPVTAKCSNTLPILPYHFLMMTDVHRLEVYAAAIRQAVRQQSKRLGRRVRVLDAGSGLGLLGMTAALEGADAWLCEAVPLMRRVSREVLAVNAKDIAEKQGLVNLLPTMMSTSLKIGKDVAEKFDIVVSEVMDLWGLGEGILPTMRHAHQHLLEDGGLLLPSKLTVSVQPLELNLWAQPEREHGVKLAPLGALLKSRFSPLRIAQVPHRMLTDEAAVALDIDFRSLPAPRAEGAPNLDGVNLCIRMGGKPALQAKIAQMAITSPGMLCGYGIWWSADLGNGHVISSAPASPQRSWKQLVRWLDEPRFVGEGEEVQVLACFNENQVNVEDVYMPKEMLDQYQEQLNAEVAQQPQPKQPETLAEARA